MGIENACCGDYENKDKQYERMSQGQVRSIAKGATNVINLLDGCTQQHELAKFLRHHEVSQLIFNGNGSLYESYLCLSKCQSKRDGGPKTSKKLLLSCIKVKLENLPKVQERVDKL